MNFERITRELSKPQAMLPTLHQHLAHAFLTDIATLRQPGVDICGGEVERPGLQIDEKGNARIPVTGVLARNLAPLMRNGATDYNEIQSEIKEALDAGAQTITLEIDSGGGGLSGLIETGKAIAEAPVPTFALVMGDAYSAAYWLASQCDKIVGAPSSGFGSIGVYYPPFWDVSKALDRAGVTVRFAFSGEHKAAGAFSEVAMTEQQFAEIKKRVEGYHSLFKEAVRSKRPQINEDHMEAQIYTGEEALINGFFDIMIDNEMEFDPQSF